MLKQTIRRDLDWKEFKINNLHLFFEKLDFDCGGGCFQRAPKSSFYGMKLKIQLYFTWKWYIHVNNTIPQTRKMIGYLKGQITPKRKWLLIVTCVISFFKHMALTQSMVIPYQTMGYLPSV